MGRVIVRKPVRMLNNGSDRQRQDKLAAEEPLELRLSGTSLSVTMRTPGHDVELAHGFLLSEGIIGSREDVRTARYCAGRDEQGHNTFNVLDVAPAASMPAQSLNAERNFTTTSSCGVCGKAALENVTLRSRFAPRSAELPVTPETLAELPDRLRERQRVFAATGGLHAAGLFDAAGTVLAVREDVGRHNAVDKVLGWALLQDRIPAYGCGLLVSGRASFELVQKAAMAGIPMLAAVSAPSSLAVELAEENGMTLVGFLRGASMNVYTGDERIAG